MYKLPNEKPTKSGKYYVRVANCPYLMPDTYEYRGVFYEDQIARYYKETDEWKILIDGTKLVRVQGNIFTIVSAGTNIGDNYIITHWEYVSKAQSTKFPPLEMPYEASDGNLFNREDLRDLYEEAIRLTEEIEKNEFNEEDFVRWNNIRTPYYNPETEKFEYKEWIPNPK